MNLLDGKLRSVSLAMTTTCNLRCVYCTVSLPGYRGEEMAEPLLDDFIDELLKMGVRNFSLSGHGETTALKHWTRYFQKLQAAGAATGLCSNFAKKFDENEIRTLQSANHISISVDTDDGELLRLTRRHVRLDTILENIRRVQEAKNGPVLEFVPVIHDKNATTVDSFVRWAMEEAKINRFSFCSVRKIPDTGGALNVDLISKLPADELQRAKESMKRALDYIKQHGGTCALYGGLRDIFTGLSDDMIIKTGPGETRDCVDPWTYVNIKPDGSFAPCYHRPPSKAATIEEFFNSDEIKNLRQAILGGELDEHCRNCPTHASISLDAFKKKLAETLNR